MFFKKLCIIYLYKLLGGVQIMLKNILLNKYESLFTDIIDEYSSIVKKNNQYDKYLKIFIHEIKITIKAFESLLVNKKNTFRSIFENDNESILYAIDKELFGYLKGIFENVSMLLGEKQI